MKAQEESIKVSGQEGNSKLSIPEEQAWVFLGRYTVGREEHGGCCTRCGGGEHSIRRAVQTGTRIRKWEAEGGKTHSWIQVCPRIVANRGVHPSWKSSCPNALPKHPLHLFLHQMMAETWLLLPLKCFPVLGTLLGTSHAPANIIRLLEISVIVILQTEWLSIPKPSNLQCYISCFWYMASLTWNASMLCLVKVLHSFLWTYPIFSQFIGWWLCKWLTLGHLWIILHTFMWSFFRLLYCTC